jgi:signal transduction histidine kinase
MFDPQVSELTDQHGRPLGYIVSLRDVTDRELRQQRIMVLNRVLRHNLRNQIEVIKANAEALSDATTSDYAPTILESATKLTDLGQQARSIDQSLSRPLRVHAFDFVSLLEESTESMRELDGVILSLETPATARVRTDQEIVRSTIESGLNSAKEYAATECTLILADDGDGYRIDITIDGDGIPEAELAPIEAGSETAMEHGTGLDLWQLAWGVIKLNGTIEFETADGTSIRFTIPQIEESAEASTGE